IHDSFKPAKAVNDKLPQELSDIIDHALTKKPGDRYQSMQQMLEELQHLSLAVRLGSSTIPDGIVTPYIVPKKQSGRGSVSAFINRMFGRSLPVVDSHPSQAA